MNVNLLFPLLSHQISQGAIWRTDECLPELNLFFLLLSPLLWQCLEAAAVCTSLILAAVWKLLAKIGKEAQGCASPCLLWAMSSWLSSMAANTSHTSKWLFYSKNGMRKAWCEGCVWDSLSSVIWGELYYRGTVWTTLLVQCQKPDFTNNCVMHDLPNSKATEIFKFTPTLTLGCSSQK